MKIEKCPECGSRRLGEGKLSGYAALSNGGWRSSPVKAVVCSNCGLILEMRVTKPQVFTPKM